MNAPLRSPDHQPDVFGAGHDKRYPSPSEMLHISIAHSGPGIQDMIRFYQVVLNMRFVYKISYPAFEFIALSHDDENHRIGILNSLTDNDDALAISQGVDKAKDVEIGKADVDPRDAPLRQCRIEHTSWLYHSIDDVIVTAKRVYDELGMWPRSSRLGGQDITIDYNDPDGNRVELLSQSQSKAQILWNIHQRESRPKDGAKPPSYSDFYLSFSMPKLVAMMDAGEPMDNLRSRDWVKQKVAEGQL